MQKQEIPAITSMLFHQPRHNHLTSNNWYNMKAGTAPSQPSSATTLCMVGEMVQNSRSQNHFQHQQPICSSAFSFYINNNIGPTSTTNTTTKTKNTPYPENESESTSTTIPLVYNNESNHLKTNIKQSQLQQQNTFNNLGRATGYGRGRLGPKNSYRRAYWEIETRGEKTEWRTKRTE